MKISIVIPIYNEAQNVEPLYTQLSTVLNSLSSESEVICVNDGSKDTTLERLRAIAAHDQRIKIIDFTRNFGQTAAMSAGITSATGDIIIPMDADLQNDPSDIPRFLEKMSEGYDVVSGWRKNRQDGLWLRKIPSRLANRLIGMITNVKVHDYGCSMKAYKREAIQGIRLYGEMHRFIPAYIAWNGGNVAEIEVTHHPRLHGRTHYGIGRTFKVLLDLLVVKFLSKYMNRPIHFFGGIGFLSFFVGLVAGLAAVVLRLLNIRHLVDTPLPMLSVLCIIIGVQFMLMGILSEMLMRTYYESQHKEPYAIKERVNF